MAEHFAAMVDDAVVGRVVPSCSPRADERWDQGAEPGPVNGTSSRPPLADASRFCRARIASITCLERRTSQARRSFFFQGMSQDRPSGRLPSPPSTPAPSQTMTFGDRLFSCKPRPAGNRWYDPGRDVEPALRGPGGVEQQVGKTVVLNDKTLSIHRPVHEIEESRNGRADRLLDLVGVGMVIEAKEVAVGASVLAEQPTDARQRTIFVAAAEQQLRRSQRPGGDHKARAFGPFFAAHQPSVDDAVENDADTLPGTAR